jgi:tryptophan synthase alpha chain
MKRIKKLFRNLQPGRRCGLVAYVTCGDPDVEATVEIVLALEEAGADAIELGVPFSDPIADGPVIQAAAQRALAKGTTTEDLFHIAAKIRERSQIPLIAFSYLNPIARFGVEKFAWRAKESGIDAVLITDLPPEEALDVREALHAADLGLVALLAPTSSDERVKLISRRTDGFIYYVSTTGVTGTRSDLDPSLIERLVELRKKTRRPLAVGFGVSKREHYRALAPHCDAVVVGSAIVRAIAEGDRDGAAVRAAAVIREITSKEAEVNDPASDTVAALEATRG